jgi:hypothetical protein
MSSPPEPDDTRAHPSERERAIGALVVGLVLGVVLRLLSPRSSA